MNSVLRLLSGREVRSKLRRAERGEDESFEFTVVVIPLVVMVMLIAFATITRTELMPAWSASSECARAAITTVDPAIGKQLGTDAALGMLASNYVNPNTALVEFSASSTWEPDTPVTCSVSYPIDISGIPWFNELMGGAIHVSSSATLRTEPYTSRWQ
jgi:hypothetical protein